MAAERYKTYAMAGMTTALKAALYIIRHDDWWCTPLRLQKLLYFTQVKALIEMKRPLFIDRIEAGSVGPFVPSVRAILSGTLDTGLLPIHLERINDMFPDVLLSDANAKIVDSVIARLSGQSNVKLTDVCLKQSVWSEAYGTFLKTMTQDAICTFYGIEDAMTTPDEPLPSNILYNMVGFSYHPAVDSAFLEFESTVHAGNLLEDSVSSDERMWSCRRPIGNGTLTGVCIRDFLKNRTPEKMKKIFPNSKTDWEAVFQAAEMQKEKELEKDEFQTCERV